MSAIVRLAQSGSNAAKAADLTSTLRRPNSSSEFFEMLPLFIHVVAALGLDASSLRSGYRSVTRRTTCVVPGRLGKTPQM